MLLHVEGTPVRNECILYCGNRERIIQAVRRTTLRSARVNVSSVKPYDSSKANDGELAS